jgi:ATP-binding cassette subfamily C (CFTR/MRP) protein 4
VTAAYILFSIGRSLLISHFIVTSATNIHNKMVEQVSRATIQFFDINPMGHILTRFSKDLGAIDAIFVALITYIVYGFFRAVTVGIMLAIINIWMVIPLLISVAYAVYVVRVSQAAMIEAQRFDAVTRGPIH